MSAGHVLQRLDEVSSGSAWWPCRSSRCAGVLWEELPRWPRPARSSSFLDVMEAVRPQGIDDVQHTEYGEPFIGNTGAGEVPGAGALQGLNSLRKGGAEGFLRDKIKEAYDELEMNVTAADLDPYTDNAAQYAVDAKEAASRATSAAREAFVREAGLGGVPAKVDHAWQAAMQAIRVAHAQRLVANELMTTRSDRQIVDVAVNKLLDRMEEAVETQDLTQQGIAVEAVKRGLGHLQDVQEYVEEDLAKLQGEQKLLDAELEEAQRFPLYPRRDYVVAETPKPDEPAPPETIIGSMDTGVPKADDLSQISYKIG